MTISLLLNSSVFRGCHYLHFIMPLKLIIWLWFTSSVPSDVCLSLLWRTRRTCNHTNYPKMCYSSIANALSTFTANASTTLWSILCVYSVMNRLTMVLKVYNYMFVHFLRLRLHCHTFYGESWYLAVCFRLRWWMRCHSNMHELGYKATLRGKQLVAFKCI